MDKQKLLFELYKDECVNASDFRLKVKNKFNLDDKIISDIYAKITNYQIEYYGGSLTNQVEYLSRTECIKRSNILRNLKQQRKRRNKSR